MSSDLSGSAPDTAPVVLLLIDVINDLEFPEGERLLEHALPMARCIAELKRRSRAERIPTIYVNDNFGKWRSDFRETVEHCRRDGVRGQPIAEMLAPDEDDYFVLKPKHSAFFSTTLHTLLEHLGARTLILTGMAGNVCVLFSAADAYMRDFRVLVPEDCIASTQPERNEQALALMRDFLAADTTPSAELDLAELADVMPAS